MEQVGLAQVLFNMEYDAYYLELIKKDIEIRERHDGIYHTHPLVKLNDSEFKGFIRLIQKSDDLSRKPEMATIESLVPLFFWHMKCGGRNFAFEQIENYLKNLVQYIKAELIKKVISTSSTPEQYAQLIKSMDPFERIRIVIECATSYEVEELKKMVDAPPKRDYTPSGPEDYHEEMIGELYDDYQEYHIRCSDNPFEVERVSRKSRKWRLQAR